MRFSRTYPLLGANGRAARAVAGKRNAESYLGKASTGRSVCRIHQPVYRPGASLKANFSRRFRRAGGAALPYRVANTEAQLPPAGRKQKGPLGPARRFDFAINREERKLLIGEFQDGYFSGRFGRTLRLPHRVTARHAKNRADNQETDPHINVVYGDQ